MKRIISSILLMIILCGCELTRDSYYTFYFDDYSICVGYDNMEYMRLVFTDNLVNTIKKNETIKDVDVYFWNKYFSSIDVRNYYERSIDSNNAIVSKMDLYLENLGNRVYRIDDKVLSESIDENCKLFNGKLIQTNTKACVFGKRVNSQNNVVILYGDYLDLNQDRLHRIEIYVE